MSTLTLVGCTSGDWEGAYIDDNLVDEGHNIDWIYVINEGNPVTKAVKLEVSSEWGGMRLINLGKQPSSSSHSELTSSLTAFFTGLP